MHKLLPPLILCAFVFMNIGPIQKQLLFSNGHYTKFEMRTLRPWIMFTANSRRVCKMSLYDQGGNHLDYVSLLGYSKVTAPKNIIRIKTEKEVKKVAQSLCYKNPQQKMFIEASCTYGRPAEWRPVLTKDKPIC